MENAQKEEPNTKIVSVKNSTILSSEEKNHTFVKNVNDVSEENKIDKISDFNKDNQKGNRKDSKDSFSGRKKVMNTKIFVNNRLKHEHIDTNLHNDYVKLIKDDVKKHKDVMLDKEGIHVIKERKDYNAFGWNDDPREFLIEEKPIEENFSSNSPYITLTCYDQRINCLVDTGSAYNCISEHVFDKMNNKNSNIPILPCQQKSLYIALKTKAIKCNKQALIDVTLGDNIKLQVPVLVIKNLNHRLILGMPFIKENHLIIDYRSNHITCHLQNRGIYNIPLLEESNNTVSFIKTNVLDDSNDVSDHIHQHVHNLMHLSNEQKQVATAMIMKHERVFSKKPGIINGDPHRIRVTDTAPIKTKIYPIPEKHKTAVDEQIQHMLDWEIIRPCPTQYLSPLVVVRKPDDSIRLCLDARNINAVTVPEYDAPPKINDILNHFKGKKFFSSTDITSSFWQIPIHIEDQKYVGFKYRNITYVWCRTPFGLRNSSASLIRALENVLKDDFDKGIMIYVDDILCASATFEEHVEQLNYVFNKLEKAGFTLKLSKSKFFQLQIPFVGHIINQEGICPDPNKIQAIRDFPTPSNLKRLRAFLGLCNYYTRFVDKYAECTEPLLKLLRNQETWVWKQEQQEAFEHIKEKFLKAVMINHPDFDKPMILQTDASDTGISACLFQEDEVGNKKVLAFISRILKPAERSYFTTEKEALALVWSVTKLRTLVLGSNLIIRTDHQALTFLKRCPLTSGRLTRWILLLNEYSFSIEHVSGKSNMVPDVLSRVYEQDDGICAISFVPNVDIKKELQNLQIDQEMDRVLGPIYAMLNGIRIINTVLRKRISRMLPKFKLENNLLWRNIRGQWRICIPMSLKKNLTLFTHEEYCHVGPRKVFYILREHFTWANMSKNIYMILRTCHSCQVNKHLNCSYRGIYKPIVPEAPNQLLSVDIYGPLPRSKHGNKYLFVCMDVFTKFTQAYPIKRPNTNNCIRMIERHYIPLAGKPDSILSDHGKAFTSAKWKLETERLQIHHIMSTIRHPESNPVERQMREINRILRTYSDERHDQWFDMVPHMNKILNEVHHETTHVTPLEAHFGTPVHRPFLDVLQLDVNVRNRDEIIQMIHERINNEGQRRKKYVTRKHHNFQVGNKVLLRTPLPSDAVNKKYKKFYPLFSGIYKITDDLHNNSYKIASLDGRYFGVYNVANLRPYFS